MVKELLTPDYIFEASWEVCNKVGGIYTVLSTRANTLQAKFRDKVFFVGPDFWQGKENPLFIESDNLCACLLYTSPSPRDMRRSRMPSSA